MGSMELTLPYNYKMRELTVADNRIMTVSTSYPRMKNVIIRIIDPGCPPYNTWP